MSNESRISDLESRVSDQRINELTNPRISIVTPSFNSGPWLPLCIASIADQATTVEHIVQDACSTDGTLDWLSKDSRVQSFVEKDQGMYDALNRGFKRAHGDIFAWLNCDEQYLPGALQRVQTWFEAHPDIDVLFGNVIMVDPKGRYISHRKMQVPLKYHTWTCHLSTLSCATFFRRRLFSERDFYFDSRLRDVGDGEWMLRLLQSGVRMATLNEFTSVFTRTGANMSAGSNAKREAEQLRASAPALARSSRPLVVVHHRLRRWLGGMYNQKAFGYEIFTLDSPTRRTRFEVSHSLAFYK